MQNFKFRPWGRPAWLRPHFGEQSWCIIACFGTERRSVKSVAGIACAGDSVIFVKIDDPGLGTASEQSDREDAYAENKKFFEVNCEIKPTYESEELKASLDKLRLICDSASKASKNIILDITSFPKRWFFPLVRFLVEDEAIENLQVIYTRGDEHASTLAENPEILRALPAFRPEDDRKDHDFAFVGVGFHTHSMLQLFDVNKAKSLQLLFPFPPGPPGIHRNWKFVEEVEMKVQKDESLRDGKEPITYMHLDSSDVSQAFDALKIVTKNGIKTSLMAPYGPKPFSLAMCLFALAVERAEKPEVPVVYSQPQKYAVEYTKDASYQHGELDSWAYGIKRRGRFIYEL